MGSATRNKSAALNRPAAADTVVIPCRRGRAARARLLPSRVRAPRPTRSSDEVNQIFRSAGPVYVCV